MSWFKWLLTRRVRENQLDPELEFHVQSLIDAKISAGMPPAEARRQALIEFGGSEQVKEECRDVNRIALADSVFRNGKSAFRFIKKSPGFSAAVIMTLALGIGANSGVFSAIDAVLLRPLPFPDSDRLIVVHQFNTESANAETPVAPQRLEDWNKLSQAFAGFTGSYTQDVSETSGALPEKLTQAIVAPRFLKVLGVSPALGRDFTPEEERFGGPSAILISDRLWRRRFNANPSATGKMLHLGDYAYTIVGVMPPSFAIPTREVDLWTVGPPDAPYAQSRDSTWFAVLARVKPGLSLLQRRADLLAVQAQLARQYPKTDRKIYLQTESLKASVVSGAGRSLWLLFGSVSLLLLIACTNIAALLLARTSERTREVAIRYSLGASRASVLAQLLTECFVLALFGSLLGLFIAAASARVFRSFAVTLPRVHEIGLDWRICLYSLLTAIIATLLCGLVPALQATRGSLAGSLAGHSRSQVSGRGALQWLLVSVQVALAVTLLVGAALLLRSFQALGRVYPGFDAGHLLTLRISAGWGETADRKALNLRMNRDLDAIRNTPGVQSAATSASLPGGSSQYPVEFHLTEGRASLEKIGSDNKWVSAGYFETMRIPLLSGSGCRSDTTRESAVVNRSFVAAFLNNQTVVGRHLVFADNTYGSPPAEILGVAADARENGLNHPPSPTVYSCASAANPSPFFLVRTFGDPAAMSATIRQKMHQVEPARSVFNIVPLDQVLSESNSENRFRTLLLTLFALTAIALAAVGLYGTLSYFVNIRQREVGLRIALGALPSQIVGRFLRQGLTVAALGCCAGLLLAATLSRLLSSMLYGVSRSDLTTYAAVAAIMLFVAALASSLPAIRAARLDPMSTLRED